MPIIIADRRMTGEQVDDQRARCQSNIKDSYEYFAENYKRFHYYRNFIFKSTMSAADVSLNQELNRPQIEFNILESRMSRLLGEFAKQEPNLQVSQSDQSMSEVDPNLINLVEGYIRSIFFECNRDNMEYEIYRELLSGGFSAFKIITDYCHEKSFDQNIIIKKCFDPTLVGFDKMAVESHKGDGMFCFECFPRNRKEFEDEYGKDLTNKMKFVRQDNDEYSFNWSYVNQGNEIVMIVDYYEKKKSFQKIVQLADGTVLTVKEYEQLGERWDKLIPIPVPIGKPRKSEIVRICRHRLAESDTLEYVETDYKYLPIIYVDGNSVMLRGEDGTGAACQMTRPMMYHMLGIQKLKNFMGIMIANHVENTPQSQWIAPKEGIPAEYSDPWINPQHASILTYNSFLKDNPDVRLEKPSQIVAPPMPNEFMQIFMSLDDLSQTMLGSFDSSLGINDNQLSGKAIYNGSVQSNAASQPYLVGFIKSLNRAAEIILDLIPKYINTPRTLPVRSSNGKQNYQKVNSEDNPNLDYNPIDLKVKVEAGVNFEIQRQQAFTTLTMLMDKIPAIAQFISTEEQGLEMLLDNIEIRGISALKAEIKPFMEKIKQQEAQQQQVQQIQVQSQQMAIEKQKQELEMQAQVLKQQALAPLIQAQQKANETDINERLKIAELAIKDFDSKTKRLDVVGKIDTEDKKIEIDSAKIAAEDMRTSIDMIREEMDQDHAHTMDMMNLHHKVNMDEFIKNINKNK